MFKLNVTKVKQIIVNDFVLTEITAEVPEDPRARVFVCSQRIGSTTLTVYLKKIGTTEVQDHPSTVHIKNTEEPVDLLNVCKTHYAMKREEPSHNYVLVPN